ncbi:MAG: hypothetical protein BHV84_08755 [Prevotella sp. AG:487_50_53]|nr:MAG: hypothetical protein BHV84_08755 [Prevotella sp. AG:487_50_53]
MLRPYHVLPTGIPVPAFAGEEPGGSRRERLARMRQQCGRVIMSRLLIDKYASAVISPVAVYGQ